MQNALEQSLLSVVSDFFVWKMEVGRHPETANKAGNSGPTVLRVVDFLKRSIRLSTYCTALLHNFVQKHNQCTGWM